MKTKVLKLILIIFYNLFKILVNFLIPKKKIQDVSLQVFLLKLSNKIQELLFKKTNYLLKVIYEPKKGKFYSEVGGVILDNSLTGRYLKINSQKKFQNEGQMYEIFFRKTAKLNFVDIGSNFGEISIYIAKKFPQTKVLSIEASRVNCFIQKNNIKINNVSNIILENAIVSNKNGFKYISKDLGSENYVNNSKLSNFKKVRSSTLHELLKKNNINFIDFLKIDIEGHAPFLSEDLVNLNIKKKIKFCMISFEKNSFESYKNILDNFKKNSLIFDITGMNITKKISSIYLENKLRKILPNEYQGKRFSGMEVLFQFYK
jgi:FkbM family methyltransferase